MRQGSIRARWAAIGAAIAVAVGGGAVWVTNAAGPAVPASFIPIVPCRLVDTRPGAINVGTRATPLGAGETATFAVWGTNGNCTIPSTATGVASNVTAVGATTAGYLTLFPADAAQPVTSNLNTSPGAPPTPNQVTVGLSAAGALKVFNNAGSVDVIIDIVGYYQAAAAGPRGFSAWDTIPSGQTVTGVNGFSGQYVTGSYYMPISLLGVAPAALVDATVNFAPDASPATIDDDATCTGTAAAPTAPAGKVCIYLYFGSLTAISNLFGIYANVLPSRAFFVDWTVTGTGPQSVFFSWAYTAP